MKIDRTLARLTLPKKALTSSLFSQAVLRWFEENGRKTLPWQKNKTPYRVWVSEIMLQQTQVETVIPFFNRFIARFPNIETLAKASEDEVLHLWTGLGYYSRARNLHSTAGIIVAEYGGKFPRKLESLQALPGIGRSTAGAIAAISMGVPTAILDGNVKRVLCRFHAITGWPGATQVAAQLWDMAERYTPKERAGDYAQAMMDLGATLCTRARPECGRCPLSPQCQAALLGTPKAFPQSKPKKDKPVKAAAVMMLMHKRRVLLEKRPGSGIWGGLYCFPMHEAIEDALEAFVQREYQAKRFSVWEDFRHTFSHYHLQMQPIAVRATQKTFERHQDSQHLWYDLDKPVMIGMAAPVKKLLKRLDDLTR